MVDNQKVVVVLLLITIILSVVSVIVTFSLPGGRDVAEPGVNVEGEFSDMFDAQHGSARLEITSPGG